jgi:hypothetical protein
MGGGVRLLDRGAAKRQADFGLTRLSRRISISHVRIGQLGGSPARILAILRLISG